MEGTRQLSTRGTAYQRAAACANGPVESVPVQAQTNPLPVDADKRPSARSRSSVDSERGQAWSRCPEICKSVNFTSKRLIVFLFTVMICVQL